MRRLNALRFVTLSLLVGFVFCLAKISTCEAEPKLSNPTTKNVSQTEIKMRQIFNPTVYVGDRNGSGSGVLFYKKPLDTNPPTYQYFVLTNNHVVKDIPTRELVAVDGLRGRAFYRTFPNPVHVVIFKNCGSQHYRHYGSVVAKSEELDLAVVMFQSTDSSFSTMLFAPKENDSVNIFDEVYLSSCQLGDIPSVTVGILSSIVLVNNNVVQYKSDCGIAPGSSGGGLFKKFGNNYAVIGIAQGMGYGSQLFSHIGYFIPIQKITDFLDTNCLEYHVVN